MITKRPRLIVCKSNGDGKNLLNEGYGPNESMYIKPDKSCLVFLDRNRAMSWAFYGSVVARDERARAGYSTISEYRGADYHYDVTGQRWAHLGDEFWELYAGLNIEDIIDRCRVLRSLSGEMARDLVKKALAFSITFFKKNAFKTLVTFTTDRYTIDLLVLVAARMGIEVIGVGGSFVKGTRRITVRGEWHKILDVADEEVEALYASLQGRYAASGRPNLGKAVMVAFRFWGSRLVRYVWHYLILHKLFGKLNYDYLLVRQQPASFFFNLLFFRKKPFYIRSVEDLKKRLQSERIYIPLHYHPEATVDYWVDTARKAYYLDSLCEVLAHFREKGVQVALKEHPAMFLLRTPEFYRTILAYENAILIWPFLETADVLKHFDKVIVWTGTTGIEAAVQGKDVYLYTQNFWASGFFRDWKETDMPSNIQPAQAKFILKKFLENLTDA